MLNKSIALFFALILTMNAWSQTSSATHKYYLAKGVEITMGDESLKNIEKIKAGDKVMAYDFESSSTIPKIVKKVHKSVHSRMVKLKLENGNEIVTIAGTPFQSSDGWRSVSPEQTMDNPKYEEVDVEECNIGEELFFYDIVSIERSAIQMVQGLNEITTAYALELEDARSAYIANSFFVGQ